MRIAMLLMILYSLFFAQTIFTRADYKQMIDDMAEKLGGKTQLDLELKNPQSPNLKIATAVAWHAYYKKPESAGGIWDELLVANLLDSALLRLMAGESKLIRNLPKEALQLATVKECAIGAPYEKPCSYIRGLALYKLENKPNSYLHNALAYYPHLRSKWRQNHLGYSIKETK